MRYDILPCLLELLDHGDEDIRKDVCSVMSNLTRVGDHIQAVIDAGVCLSKVNQTNERSRC